MKKRLLVIFIAFVFMFALCLQGCEDNPNPTPPPDDNPPVGWDGNSVTYSANDIAKFGSATPMGFADNNGDGTVSIYTIDQSLDNYGGVQTPKLTLDFSKAVTFRMTVVSCYSQYIVKLAVEGESEYYYVLSDEGATGEISVNVVDAMLCDKYRGKNTQPDPGYQGGWKYNGLKKNCIFHILAKGPDGESQTAELVIKDIAIYNNETAVQGVEISSDKLSNGVLTARKNSTAVNLSASVKPSTITDKTVTFKSLDETVATVTDNGQVGFVGVGVTEIIATSKIDQSKSAKITVNVTSGYENVTDLKQALTGLTYNGSTANAELFNDLFKTTWASDNDMTPTVSANEYSAADIRISGGKATIRNYFDGSGAHNSEANGLSNGGNAYLSLNIANAANATVYRNIDGKLYAEQYGDRLAVQYLTKQSGNWAHTSQKEQIIVVFADGSVKKLSVTVVSSVKIADYSANDFANANLWTIPDQYNMQQNAVIRTLSPATVRVENGVAVLKQNKYSHAKYCFGGLASNVYAVNKDKQVEILLDVQSLNQMNDYVKTMWELKIIYYQADGVTAVSSNPLKLDSGNVTGLQSVVFTPAYDHFVVYLVVNGSDIGAQFADAEMKIKSMQIYSLN